MSWNRRVLNRLPILLLLTFFSLGMAQVRAASITFDEGPHLAIGYTTLRTGDLRLQPIHIHPPLANILSAAPLLLQDDLPDPTAVNGWSINSLSAITDAVVWQYPRPARIATAGRVPILLLGVLLGAVVSRWASDLGGRMAGGLALALCALDPNLIAHSAVITTDAAAVTLGVATLYALTRANAAHVPAPSIRHGGGERQKHATYLVLTGIFLGLAQLTKVSALMLVPVVCFLLIVASWLQERSSGRTLRTGARECAIVLLLAGLVLWAGYGFEIGDVPGLPVKVPLATHLRIFLALREHYDLGHPTYAFGRVSDRGWWWYFPAAFAVKTPLPTLILLCTSGVVAARRLVGTVTHRRRSVGPGMALTGPDAIATALPLAGLAVFPASYALSSLFSSVNIGYRHLLPVLPFLYIGIAQAAVRVRPRHPREAKVVKIAGLTLFAWLAVGTAAVSPHLLTFFNELVGGASNGHRYLVDSNLDWGQNLWDLAGWMGAHDRDHIAYAHYSPADPKVYGIDATFLPPDPRAVSFTPWRPEPGLYAIGATVLEGPYAPDINTYAWFRSRQPTAQLGNALFVYEVPHTPAPAWVVVCVPTLGDREVAKRLGTEELRTIRPDCSQATVFPAERSRGLYVLPAAAEPPPDSSWILTLRDSSGEATTTVFEADADGGMPDHNLAGQYDFDGPLAFVGYSLSTPGSTVGPGATLVLRTFWDVVTLPSRPLSLMAHALDGDGNLVTVGDGLGFQIEQWHTGDRIVQIHQLTLPEAREALPERITLQIGGYWLDSLMRWSINGTETSILLTTLATDMRQ